MIKGRDIIQVNATIIAGLFVLIAIQFAESPISYTQLIAESDSLAQQKNTSDMMLKADQAATLTAIQDLHKDPNNGTKQFVYEEAKKNFENDMQWKYQILSKISDVDGHLDVANSVPGWKWWFIVPTMEIVSLLTPFFFSIFIEILHSSRSENDNASRWSLILICGGIFWIIISMIISITTSSDVFNALLPKIIH